MRIDIDETYWVSVDSWNHTLYKHNLGGEVVEGRGKKAGTTYVQEPYDESIGYYPNMLQCVTKAIELKLIEDQGVYNLLGYLDRLEWLIKDLKGKITG